MKTRIYRFCAIFLMPIIAILNCPVAGTGAPSPAATMEISHSPETDVEAGERLDIKVEVTDESGVYDVRVYFKAVDAAEYSYIVLESKNGEDFSGVLPAPANGAGSFEYLILVQNGDDKVYRTQTYTVTVEDDPDAEESIEGNAPIKVYTELLQYPAGIDGFADKIVIAKAGAREKLGVVAGLYRSENAGPTTSRAMPGGTINATDDSPSSAVVWGSVAAVAVIGGALAAGGGGGGGGGTTTPEPDPEPEPEPEPPDSSFLHGLWYWESNSGDYGTVTFSSDGSYSRFGSELGTVSGSWTYSQDNSEHNWLVMEESDGMYSGEAYEDSSSISVVGSQGYSDTLTIYQ